MERDISKEAGRDLLEGYRRAKAVADAIVAVREAARKERFETPGGIKAHSDANYRLDAAIDAYLTGGGEGV